MVRFSAALLAGPAAISVAVAQPADPPRSWDAGAKSVGWTIVDMKLDGGGSFWLRPRPGRG